MTTPLLHTITFTWKAQVERGAVAALERALYAYAASATGLRLFTCGPDLGLVEGNADFAIVALFESEAAFAAYRAAEAHKQLVSALLLPMLAARSAVQLTFEDNPGGMHG